MKQLLECKRDLDDATQAIYNLEDKLDILTVEHEESLANGEKLAREVEV